MSFAIDDEGLFVFNLKIESINNEKINLLIQKNKINIFKPSLLMYLPDCRPVSARIQSIETLVHLSNSKNLKGKIKIVNMRMLGIKDSDIGLILTCLKRIEVREIMLWNNPIGPVGARALATSPHLSDQTKLEWSKKWLNMASGEDFLDAFDNASRIGMLERLTKMSFSDQNIGDQGVKLISENQFLANLSELYIDRNNISNEGLAALVGSRYMSKIKKLSLEENRINGGGVKLISRSKHMGQLMELNIIKNSVDDDSVLDLLNRTNLRLVHLSDDCISFIGARALAKAPHLSAQIKLKWSRRWLDLATGREFLDAFNNACKVGVFNDESILFLSDQAIGDEGVKLIASQPCLANIVELYLDWNSISNEGLTALANSPYMSKIKKLSIAGNSIGEAGVKIITASKQMTQLRDLIT